MAPFGFKLWENAFQTIPDISFFVAPIFWRAIFFKKWQLIFVRIMDIFSTKNFAEKKMFDVEK